MARDNLTHSEKYIKKTNRIILTIGITSLIIFIFGVILLIKSNRSVDDYEEPVFTDNADVLNMEEASPLTQNIEFGTIDGEIPLTATPDPVLMGQVILGTDAKNVLTLGTNGQGGNQNFVGGIGRTAGRRIYLSQRLRQQNPERRRNLPYHHELGSRRCRKRSK